MPQSDEVHNADTPSLAPDLILNPEGKKMVPFFHVMISYRVDTEQPLARQMFDRLLLNSFERIPKVGMPQWPPEFTRPEKHRPGHANVFLDKFCLKTGENWDHNDQGGGFVGALLKSLIFVPLLSWKADPEIKDDPKSKKMLKDSAEENVELERGQEGLQPKQLTKFTGSIGEMIARFSGAATGKEKADYIDPDPKNRSFHDAVDNVLLELILAMELHAHLKKAHKGASCMHPCLRLFPVAVDKIDDFFNHFSYQLPEEVSTKTYDKASKYLKDYGIHINVSERKTVRGVVSYFFQKQMEKFTDFGEADFALDTVCNRIIATVRDVVSNIDPLSLFKSKPLCAELDSFLSKRNCSYMTRILAANNITSLRQLSMLTHQNAIYDLAKDCSFLSSKSAVAELTTLTSVIDESKRDEASWLLSVRLDRFIDRDASFETVIKSSSGLIISCAQKTWLTMYFLLGMALLIIGVMSIVSSGPGANTIFDIVGAAFLFGVCLAAVFHTPKRAYLVYCCMWPALAVSIIIGFGIDFIKNNSFSLDNATRCSSVGIQLQTSFRTCAVAQIVCGPLLLVFIILLNFYQALQRQNLAWNTFLFSCVLYLVTEVVFEVSVLGSSASSPVSNYVILFFVACIFALTELMNALARHKASEKVANDQEMYQASWDALLKRKSVFKEEILTEEKQLDHLTVDFLNFLSEELKSAGSVEVLQDCKDIDVLYARAEFINDAFQSLVSILLETGLSCVHRHGSSNTTPLKKELELFFAEDDIDKILKLKHLKPRDANQKASQHTKEDDGSGKAMERKSEQISQGQLLPGQPFNSNDSYVTIESNAEAKNLNKTAPQHTTEGNGSAQAAMHSGDAKTDGEHNRTDGDAAKSNTTAPTVLLRRGPVKLPARAIAKVSPPPLKLPPSCCTHRQAR